MPSPNRRTWTLKSLRHQVTYLLWFDPAARRWEVLPVDDDLVVQRGTGRRRRAAGDGPGEGEAKPPSRTVPGSASPAPRPALGDTWPLPS
jgi:hypothetical protein